jgi:hypothetical protein
MKEKSMFLLKFPGWSDREFSTYLDAQTAGDFVLTTGGITSSEYTITEVFMVNGRHINAALVNLIRATKGQHIIACIKAIRALTDAGLKESKDFVDAL